MNSIALYLIMLCSIQATNFLKDKDDLDLYLALMQENTDKFMYEARKITAYWKAGNITYLNRTLG